MGGDILLIKDLSFVPQPNLFKHAAEIILDEIKEFKLAGDLGEISFSTNGAEELKGFLTKNNRGDLVTIVIPRVQQYLIKGGYDNLFRDYARTRKISTIMKSSVKKRLVASGISVDYDSTLAWDRVLEKFSDFFDGSPKETYPISQGCLGAWMVNSFNSFFLASNWKNVVELFTAKSTFVKAGDGDYNLTTLLESRVTEVTQHFNFERDIKNIVDASVYLYANSLRSGRAVYSNLFFAYLQFLTQNALVDLEKGIRALYAPTSINRNKKNILSSNPFFIPIYTSVNKRIDSDYKLGTLKLRNLVTNELFPLMHKRVNPAQFQKLYETVFTIDLQSVTSKNLGCLFKYQKTFSFNDPDEYQKAFDNPHNHEVFLTIFRGVHSLGQLVSYCKLHSIALHSIPMEIFENDSYYKRFTSLEDCLCCYEATSSLIKESNKMSQEFLTNDRLYFLLKQKANFSFSSIVDLLNAPANEEMYSKTALKSVFTKLYNYCSDVIPKINAFRAYIVENYQEEGDTMYDTVLSASFSWSSDQQLLQLVASCLTSQELGIISNLFIDQELILGCYRFLYLKMAFLFLMINNLNAVIDLDDFSFLQELDCGTIKKFPKNLLSSEDLLHFKDSLDLAAPPELDFAFFTQISKLYQQILAEYKDLIPVVHKLFDQKLNKFLALGVETQLEAAISETLELASIGIYDTKEKSQLQKFNVLKSFCTLKSGYLFRGNEPVTFEGLYLHEYGYLVSSKGVVLDVTQAVLDQIKL